MVIGAEGSPLVRSASSRFPAMAVSRTDGGELVAGGGWWVKTAAATPPPRSPITARPSASFSRRLTRLISPSDRRVVPDQRQPDRQAGSHADWQRPAVLGEGIVRLRQASLDPPVAVRQRDLGRAE